MTYSDGAYSDYQYINISVNPSYITLDDNSVSTSIAARGRIGHDDPDADEPALGVGFVFHDNSILYEMGLMMGTSSSNIFNNVRGINTTVFDQDFSKLSPIKEIIPGLRSTSEVNGSFFPTFLSTLEISYKCLTTRESPFDQFIIVEYTITNNNPSAINNFRFGIFADWDISSFGANDAAGWDAVRKLGYIFPKQSPALPHGGIQLLNSPGTYYAIDNDPTIDATAVGLYDGYTDVEKFTTLSTPRTSAGFTKPEGNDVSHVVAASPVNIPAGGKVVFAFALHAAVNLTELQASADAADLLYNQIFNLPKPVVAVTPACYGSGATITATGAANFKWYKNAHWWFSSSNRVTIHYPTSSGIQRSTCPTLMQPMKAFGLLH